MKPKSCVIWFTGLPASGKSTLAKTVAERLASSGASVESLDGDAVRKIFPQTGFSKEERDQHVKRVGHIASLLERHGVTVVVSLISPYEDSRQFVRSLCRRFIEVYVSTPLEVCQKRDPKGLYAKVKKGLIKNFTGVDDPYEIPKNPEIVIDTQNQSPAEAADKIISFTSK